MGLSKRLQAVADMVTEGNVLVDVGCDHGYLPIDLLMRRRIPRAVAMDIRKGPLERARQNIIACHLEEYIETRLSDGLLAMPRAEGETLVLAGMGGPLMEKILTEGEEAARGFAEWILQPQSDVPSLRRRVEQMGRQIAEERIVKEDGKYYPMLRAIPGSCPYGNPVYYSYGKDPLERRDPVLLEFLQKEEKQRQEILKELEQSGTPGAKRRRQELLEEQKLTEAALHYYEM